MFTSNLFLFHQWLINSSCCPMMMSKYYEPKTQRWEVNPPPPTKASLHVSVSRNDVYPITPTQWFHYTTPLFSAQASLELIKRRSVELSDRLIHRSATTPLRYTPPPLTHAPLLILSAGYYLGLSLLWATLTGLMIYQCLSDDELPNCFHNPATHTTDFV